MALILTALILFYIPFYVSLYGIPAWILTTIKSIPDFIITLCYVIFRLLMPPMLFLTGPLIAIVYDIYGINITIWSIVIFCAFISFFLMKSARPRKAKIAIGIFEDFIDGPSYLDGAAF